MSQRVAIIGYGVEGHAAYRYFTAQGAKITIVHKARPDDLPDDVDFIQRDHVEELRGYDVVVRSPAVRPDSIHTDGRLTTVTKEFLSVVGRQRIIGVTASKGKGTMASLIYAMLRAAGKRVHLAGNIGLPALDLLPDLIEGDYVVLELSSFQLWDVTLSPHIAVVGMIVADHLDVHVDFEEYLNAKANIARWQTSDDVLIYHPTNKYAKQIAELSAAETKLRYDSPEAAFVKDRLIKIGEQVICEVSDVPIVGRHNLENICAALSAAWRITQDVAALKRAIEEFHGLEHRLEFVRQLGDVDYYDDSFAANTAATIVAAQAFDRSKVMILGGYDRRVDLKQMVDELSKTNLRKVLLIGQTASKLAELFTARGKAELIEQLGEASMSDIVRQARRLARPGDVVILSPGCASFDMFVDYKDRGDQFKEAVKAL